MRVEQAVKPMLIGLLVLLFASSCMMGSTYMHGTRVTREGSVEFLYESGLPVRGARVYVLETFGNEANIITELRETDDNGLISIGGTHCFPLEVATDGGSIIIDADNIASKYTVTVRSDHLPTLDQMYGQPRSDLAAFRNSPTYNYCGSKK